MPFFEWDDSYSVGNAGIDAQHKILVQLVNELHEAVENGRSDIIMAEVFRKLAEYTSYHFASEEKLFSTTDYPGAEAHKAEHARLLEEVDALKNKFQTGNSYIRDETLNFLKEWISHHLLETDNAMKDFI